MQDKEWNWFQNVSWTLKEKTKRFFRYLTTHKCEAKGCTRRLDGKYKWCSLECYVYCGGKLKQDKNNE